MGTASLHLDAWSLAWRVFWDKLAPRCSHRDCSCRQSFWRRLRGQRGAIRLRGARYCVDHCLERALTDLLPHTRFASRRGLAPHRIPLGLVLLSRQQLTEHQLRTALTAQQAAGRGRIGEWLQTLGFASELQVTAALARQWSCPVLRVHSDSPSAGIAAAGNVGAPQIPLTLLASFAMIPVDFVAARATLHIAFGEAIDYGVLYAIEQMMGCHTEPCMAVPSYVRQKLQALSQRRGESEVVFDRVADPAEFARIVRSYCVRVAASEVSLAACGPYLWVRLSRPSGLPLDLLLREPPDGGGPASVPPRSVSIPAF
jgi:hypothetical protein